MDHNYTITIALTAQQLTAVQALREQLNTGDVLWPLGMDFTIEETLHAVLRSAVNDLAVNKTVTESQKGESHAV